LDIEIDESLKLEGILRELTRQVNNSPKGSRLTINDKIKLTYETSAPCEQVFADNDLVEKLKFSVLAARFPAEWREFVKVNDEEIKFSRAKM